MIPHGQETFRGCFADLPDVSPVGCAGMDQLLLIARKRGHVIEENQCVNTAFLMQGVCMG